MRVVAWLRRHFARRRILTWIEDVAAVRLEAREPSVLLIREELLSRLKALGVLGRCHLLALARQRRVAKRDAADEDVKDESGVVIGPTKELAMQRERVVVCGIGTSVLIGLARLVTLRRLRTKS